MGLLSVDLLITLQILPGFFSNCLFLALYDSVVLVKHVLLQLNRSKSSQSQWRRMLTPEGMRCVWNSFLLDAYKQVHVRDGILSNQVICPAAGQINIEVKLGGYAPNSSVFHVSNNRSCRNPIRTLGQQCHLLDFANTERPLVVNFGSAT